MRGRIVIALVALPALAVGCGSGSKSSTSAAAPGPAVAWSSERPPQLAPRTPAARACRASDLRIDGEVKFVAHLQGGIALALLRNVGKQPCRLTGRPQVRFVKANGPAQSQRTIPTTPARFPEVIRPPSSLLALRPGEPAALTISWENWCQAAVPGKPHLPPSAIRVTLPGGRGHVDADYNAVVRCIDPKQPSIVGVSRFQSSLLPTGRPWTPAALRATVPGQPLHARRGGVLRYRVVLHDVDTVAARFDRCPATVQQLAPSGGVAVYRLNCAAAKPISPGASEAFSMELRVPKNAPLGPNGLFWALDPLGGRSPQLNARVIVEQ